MEKKKGKNRQSKEDEQDAHYRIYGKKFYEAKYSDEICPICKSRIDELGYCACGAGGM
ncbi:MAG: hypothetical protein ACP5NE_03030 [Candidatus Micrarchaeia archaeon]